MANVKLASVGVLLATLALVVYGKDHAVAIYCPRCTNPMDWTTCTKTQHCHNSHDICELHVNVRNHRAEYICHNHHACHDSCHEGVCRHCCWNLQECEEQRKNLFSTVYTATPATTTTSPKPATATTTTTSPQPASTSTSTSKMTSTPTTTSRTQRASSSTASTTSATTNTCIQCGDFDTKTSCDESELANGTPVTCADDEKYCFSHVSHNDTRTHFYKGCAKSNFCYNEWWSYTNKNPDCDQPDMSTSDYLDCVFCCEGSNCNVHLRPEDDTLATFKF